MRVGAREGWRSAVSDGLVGEDISEKGPFEQRPEVSKGENIGLCGEKHSSKGNGRCRGAEYQGACVFEAQQCGLRGVWMSRGSEGNVPAGRAQCSQAPEPWACRPQPSGVAVRYAGWFWKVANSGTYALPRFRKDPSGG